MLTAGPSSNDDEFASFLAARQPAGGRDIDLPADDEFASFLASRPPVPTHTTITTSASTAAAPDLDLPIPSQPAPQPPPPPGPLPEPETHFAAAARDIGLKPPPPVMSRALPPFRAMPPGESATVGALDPLTEAARGVVSDAITGPVTGPPQFVRGAGALMAGVPPTGAPPTAPMPKPSPDELLTAASDALAGAIKTGSPLLVSGAVTAPLETLIVTTGATLAGAGAGAATEQLGGSPAAQQFVETLAAATAAGVVGSKGMARFARGQVAKAAEAARAARAAREAPTVVTPAADVIDLQRGRGYGVARESEGELPPAPEPSTPTYAPDPTFVPPGAEGTEPNATAAAPPRAPAAPPKTAVEQIFRDAREAPELVRAADEMRQKADAAKATARAAVDDEFAQFLATRQEGTHAVQEQGGGAGRVRGLPGTENEGPGGDMGGRDAGGDQELAGPRREEIGGAPPEAIGDQRVPEAPVGAAAPAVGATMEASRAQPETLAAGAPEEVAPRGNAAPAAPAAGPLAPDRAAERVDVTGAGLEPAGLDQPGAAARRARVAEHERAALAGLVEHAVQHGHTGDPWQLHAELADRLQLLKDLDAEFTESGHHPETLLREIAQHGGLSVGAETGLKGELRWLREFQDRTGGTATKPRFSFGQVRGVQNVFREKGGRSVDDMLGVLRQDPRFAHLETPDDLVEEIRAAASAEHPGAAVDRLVQGLGERWWERIGHAPDVVDTLDTGEGQPRLPDAGAARQVGHADTTFRAPTQASGDDFARDFLGENEMPIEVEPDLFNDEPGSSGLPRRPFRGAWERLPPEPGARKPPPPVKPKGREEPAPQPDLFKPESGESGMPMQRFGKQDLPVRPAPAQPPARRLFGKKRVLPVAEMVHALTKLFNGVPVSVGRFSRRNLGIYKHQPESVRVQVADDLQVIAHEMGHHLDLAIMGGSAAFTRGPIAKELKAVGAATSLPSYSAEQQRHEGTAEYFRRWLTEPESVAQQAPLFTKAFEQYLERHPKIGEGLKAIQAEAQRYLQLPAVEQARLHLDFEGGGRGILTRAKELAAGGKSPEGRARAIAYLSSQWMDDLAYLRLAEEDMADGRPVDIVRSAYVQARLARGAASKAEGFLQFGVRDDDGQFIGRSFDDAIAPVYDRLEDFALYAAATRAQGLHRRGKESGFTTAQITDTLERLKSPAFDRALEGLRQFHRAKLDYMRQGGMLSADQVAKLRKVEPDYIPYQRVQDAVDSALSGKKIANRGSPVKRMKGSGRRIVNPLETIIRNTHAEVSAVETNKAMQALVRLVRTTHGSGKWMEEIPEPQVATRFNLKHLEKDIAAVLEDAGVELPEGGTTLDEILDTLVTVFTPQQFARGNTRIVTVLENGKRAWFEVHDEGLYDAITAIGPRGAEEVVKLFFKGARVLRRTAVATLGFLIRNPIKDQLSATVQSRAGYRPGIEWLRGLYQYLGKGEAYQLYLHSGGDQAMLVSTDRDVVRRRLRTLGHGPLRKLVDHTILGPLDGVEALAAAGERASRIGEFMRTLERRDGTDRGALMQAGLNARDVTQDFQRAGRQARAWNQYTAFFSARLGGYGRMWEAFDENPTGFLWKAISAIALPSLLLWVVNHQDAEYNELPAWERNYYWHVPIKDLKTFRTTGFIRLPKPFELGQIFGSGTELALEKLLTKDPQIADRFLDQRSAYQLVQSIIPTALLPWIEIAANYDFFRDRTIVDPSRQALPAELQYNRWTSETAKGLGRILGVSPAKIETLIYGYTAGVGQGVVQQADALLGSKKPAGGPGRWPVVGTLYRPLATSDAESLSEFYTARDALAALKAGVKDWHAMGQDDRAKREIEKQRPWLAAKAARIPAVDAQMKDFRTQVNAVFANPTLTPDQKRAALNDLYLVMLDLARGALGKPPIQRPREWKPPAPVPARR